MSKAIKIKDFMYKGETSKYISFKNIISMPTIVNVTANRISIKLNVSISSKTFILILNHSKTASQQNLKTFVNFITNIITFKIY